jgi:hypothetical protein
MFDDSSPVSAAEPVVIQQMGLTKIRLLPPGPGNPRNSEGAFISLKDGTLLFVYTHFTGGGADNATAHLAARSSTCDSSGLSDTSGSQIMVLLGGPKDEQVRVRNAAEAAQV